MAGKSKIIVWRFVDGKPGHNNQSLGLSRALGERVPIREYTLVVPTKPHYLINWLLGRFPDVHALPNPQLILGAGHATHYPMLRSRKRHGGKIIVLMRPSLPTKWFDLCILPEHDHRSDHETNTLITRGALNAIQPAPDPCTDQGLFLIGGPSNHFYWNDDRIIEQITETIRAHDIHWSLTTSRRTPESFLAKIRQRAQQIPEGLAIFPHQQTDQCWLPQQLRECATVSVTADSVSMIYEALTAGAHVELLELKPKKNDRVARGIQGLIDDGWVRPHHQTGTIKRPHHPDEFNEAARCARWIDEQWLQEN